MANIFKTTLKKDIIADISGGKREVRFPITKFWATRFADKYNLSDRTFVFKTFDSVEFSSPSNKETGGDTYSFDFDMIFVDGDEFVVVFKESIEVESCEQDINIDAIKNEDFLEKNSNLCDVDVVECDGDSDMYCINDNTCENELLNISNDDILDLLKQWIDDEKILDNFYDGDTVFATNAKQIIVLPKGKVLGFKKSLPVNNDAEIRIEFDTNEKFYFDKVLNFDSLEDEILNILNEIRKNNFVFVWKRYTGIFIDENGIYFGIKYSTRKSIGFNRKYSIQ